MRTKTLLLTAALTAAGALTSMAQVYSVNIVGYINVNVPHGFSILANQLNNSPDNHLATLFPTPPNGTFVYKFNNASSSYLVDDYDSGWEGDTAGAMTLNPGEGVFINNPSTAFTATFVGEVQLVSSVSIPLGFSIVSSVIPQSAFLDSMGYVPANGDFVYQFQNATSTYKVNDYDSGWEGDDGGNPPTPAVGEGFFVKSPVSGARSWSRTFVVGPP
jgi:hypothetical protein